MYPEPVRKALGQRLINKKQLSGLQINHLYDVLCEKGRITLLDGQLDGQDKDISMSMELRG